MLRQHDTTFAANQALAPEQIYLSAIGMLDAAGYTCELVVTGRGKPFEYARVYIRNEIRHILYFPGSDDHQSYSDEVKQLNIIKSANAEICRHFDFSEHDLENVRKHYLILDAKFTGCYIYGYAYQKQFQTTEAINRFRVERLPYDYHGLDSLQPTLKRSHLWRQTSSNTSEAWEVGHTMLCLFERSIKPVSSVREKSAVNDSKVTPELLEHHQHCFQRGKFIAASGVAQEKYREGLPVRAATAAITKFKIRPSEVLKSILKGLLIGLIIAACITTLVYTFGGAAAIIATAGLVGGACGFVGVGSSVAFGLGLFSGAMSLLVAAYAVYKNYSYNKMLYRSSLPDRMQQRFPVQANAVNTAVFDELGVTSATLNQVGETSLPPPPPYSEEMAKNAAAFLQLTDAQPDGEVSESVLRPH